MSCSLGTGVRLERVRPAQRERSQHLRGGSVVADDAPSAPDRFGDIGIDRHLDTRMSAGHGGSVPVSGPTHAGAHATAYLRPNRKRTCADPAMHVTRPERAAQR